MNTAEKVKFIVDHSHIQDLVIQVSEEASEVSHAACKLIRTMPCSTSPTPVSTEEAVKMLLSEFGDLLCAMEVFCVAKEKLNIGGEVPSDFSARIDRWFERISERVGKVDNNIQ